MWPSILVFLTVVTVACARPDAPQTDTIIDHLARAVSLGLTHSPILKKSLPFAVRNPHDMFFRVGTKLLKKAGIKDPNVAEVAAGAAAKVAKKLGKLSSKLYICTVGYEVAKFLAKTGLLTDDTVVYFAFMIVNAVELEACVTGAHDAESMTTSVVYGIFQIFDFLGFVSYDDMKRLFNVFAQELLLQAKKGQCV